MPARRRVADVLTKDLLRVSRAGGGYHPQFADDARRDLAARVIGVYQGHVDRSRADLEDALADLEREAPDFKLVRGFAKLLEREATFETRSPVPPERARRAAFAAGESVGVVGEIHPAVLVEHDLEVPVAAFEFDLSALDATE